MVVRDSGEAAGGGVHPVLPSLVFTVGTHQPTVPTADGAPARWVLPHETDTKLPYHAMYYRSVD